MLELKRGDRPRVWTDVLEFIALSFPFSSELKFFAISRRSCAGMAKKCTKKRDARAKMLFCFALNLCFFNVFDASLNTCCKLKLVFLEKHL